MKPSRNRSVATLSAAVLLVLSASAMAAQARAPRKVTAEQYEARRQMLSQRTDKRLAEEAFVGVTSDGRVEPGLFEIASTGVSTEPVRRAAEGFLESLSVEQRRATLFPVDHVEWRSWMNQHFYKRRGVSFLEMSASQREAAFELMAAGLSARGLELSKDIMRLNHTLGELNDDNWVEYGEWLYHLTVMGTPSATEPWGWQLDGHHLIVNYFVLGDQVVMSPVFVGSEPVTAEAGKFKGITILQEEQAAGLAFVNSLTDAQRGQAILDSTKVSNNNQGEALQDNLVMPYEGLPATALTAEQRADLVSLMSWFINNQSEPHAKVRREEVLAHLDRTHLAWVGDTAEDAVFYYRIHSPVILIEFDHQRPANLGHLMPRVPSRQHIHVVVRTPNGNDYGKDLLRQHLESHPHQ